MLTKLQPQEIQDVKNGLSLKTEFVYGSHRSIMLSALDSIVSDSGASHSLVPRRFHEY